MVNDYSPEDKAGIMVVVVASLVSLVSVLGLLLHIIVNKIIRYWPLERLTTAMPYYFINLLFFDVLMAIGSVLNAHWVRVSKVEVGGLCTTQAVIKQMGNVGVAWTTTLIALHCGVQYYSGAPEKHPHTTGIVMVMIIWVAICLLVGIPSGFHPRDDYYGISGKWCWIKKNRTLDIILSEYMWFWICTFLTISIYLLIWLHASGRITGSLGRSGIWVAVCKPTSDNERTAGLGFGFFKMRPGPRFGQNSDTDLGNELPLGPRDNRIPTHRPPIVDQTVRKSTTHKAKLLLLYPLAYGVVILPQSIIRLSDFIIIRQNPNYKTSIELTALGATVFSLSGFVNVVLYCVTGRQFGTPGPRNQRHLGGR